MTGKPRRSVAAFQFVAALALSCLGTGCAFGPKALERTHGRYYESIRLVYEEQLLRNIVHLRYTETPSDLEVANIAAQYELSAQAEARPFFVAPNPSNSNVIFKTFSAILPDASVSSSDRPTITLDPSFDGTAVRKFLTPMPADTLLFVTQTNWPVSVILRLWVERLNGVPNAIGGPAREAHLDFVRFQRAAELMQAVGDRQLADIRAEEHVKDVSGPLPAEAVTAAALVEAAKNGLEYRPLPDKKTWTLIRRERRMVLEVRPEAAASPEVAELYGLLNLIPGLPRYELIVAAGAVADPLLHPGAPKPVLHLEPRSTSQVFFYLANGVIVPPEHAQAGLVHFPVDAEGHVCTGLDITRGLFTVYSCKGHKPPPCAYVSINYRDHWYYIDDRDQASKATLMLMLQLSRLDFARQHPGGGPMLTLPAGR